MICPYCKEREEEGSKAWIFHFCSQCFQKYFGIKPDQWNATLDKYIFNNYDSDFAFIYSDGTKCWYKNNQLHRDNDQPAIIYSSGSKHWYKNGQRHRDNDQPAVIFPDGTKRWYKNGKFIKKEEKK